MVEEPNQQRLTFPEWSPNNMIPEVADESMYIDIWQNFEDILFVRNILINLVNLNNNLELDLTNDQKPLYEVYRELSYLKDFSYLKIDKDFIDSFWNYFATNIKVEELNNGKGIPIEVFLRSVLEIPEDYNLQFSVEESQDAECYIYIMTMLMSTFDVIQLFKDSLKGIDLDIRNTAESFVYRYFSKIIPGLITQTYINVNTHIENSTVVDYINTVYRIEELFKFYPRRVED